MKPLLVALLLACAIAPAGAVDFSKPILDDEGKPICAQDLKPGEPCPADKIFTLGVAARNALFSVFPDEQNLPGEQRAERGDLARAIRSAAPGDFKLKLEDRALIKKLIGKAYGPLIVSGAWRLLEDDKPASEK